MSQNEVFQVRGHLRMSHVSHIQSSPEKTSENLFFLFKETKNFIGTDCWHSFDSYSEIFCCSVLQCVVAVCCSVLQRNVLNRMTYSEIGYGSQNQLFDEVQYGAGTTLFLSV